ncbi:MAG: hypothetical protein MUF80_09770 [Burkholderiales bacterium]|nr:hypothetical protein [Burkholderiales bacterium]
MRKTTMQRLAVLLVAAAALAACSIGTQFVRPAQDSIELGKTTYRQLVERLGKPDDEKPLRWDGVELRSVSWTYANNADVPKVPDTLGIRQLEYLVANDVVVGERFASSFASDHTDFDEKQVARIVEGTTRCEEVIALLGRPGARAIHPVADKPGNTAIGYVFQYFKRPLLQFNVYTKTLVVQCGTDGVVRQVKFTEEGTP